MILQTIAKATDALAATLRTPVLLWVLLAFGAALPPATHAAPSAGPADAPSASNAPASAPDSGLTGFWALRYDSRNIPPAVLLPAVTSAQLGARRQADAQVIRWCRQVGMPLLMDSGAPLDIVQSRTQVAITAQIPSAPRHIYLDRAAPPSADTLDPTANGFSIGHWDGQTLWVHTTGFSDKAYTSLPGGGYPTAPPSSRSATACWIRARPWR